MLPSDLDIFSPDRRSMPLCAHTRAKGRPAAPDWATSFSWWGKIRSRPPPCTSNRGPSSFSAIAEHSMCHPGRPSPHGEGQRVSSPGFVAFQSAKSSGSRLCSPGSTRAPARRSSGRWPDSSPYAAKLRTAK